MKEAHHDKQTKLTKAELNQSPVPNTGTGTASTAKLFTPTVQSTSPNMAALIGCSMRLRLSSPTTKPSAAEEFQVWILTVRPDRKATLTCDDGNGISFSPKRSSGPTSRSTRSSSISRNTIFCRRNTDGFARAGSTGAGFSFWPFSLQSIGSEFQKLADCDCLLIRKTIDLAHRLSAHLRIETECFDPCDRRAAYGVPPSLVLGLPAWKLFRSASSARRVFDTFFRSRLGCKDRRVFADRRKGIDAVVHCCTATVEIC